jgi:hypothetical protein
MIKKLIRFIVKWFWKAPIKPVKEDKRIPARDLAHNFIIIKYDNQQIQLRKNELGLFNAMSRKDKRAMASKFRIMESKGMIKFEEIDGKLTCVRTRGYDYKEHFVK